MKYSFKNYLVDKDQELAENLLGKIVGAAKAGAQGLLSGIGAGIKGAGQAAAGAVKQAVDTAKQSYANRDIARAQELMNVADDKDLKAVLDAYIKQKTAAAAPAAGAKPAAAPAAGAKPAAAPAAAAK